MYIESLDWAVQVCIYIHTYPQTKHAIPSLDCQISKIVLRNRVLTIELYSDSGKRNLEHSISRSTTKITRCAILNIDIFYINY